MSRYLYCNRIKGGKKKCIHVRVTWSPCCTGVEKKNWGKKKSKMAKKKKEEEEEDFLEEF